MTTALLFDLLDRADKAHRRLLAWRDALADSVDRDEPLPRFAVTTGVNEASAVVWISAGSLSTAALTKLVDVAIETEGEIRIEATGGGIFGGGGVSASIIYGERR